MKAPARRRGEYVERGHAGLGDADGRSLARDVRRGERIQSRRRERRLARRRPVHVSRSMDPGPVVAVSWLNVRGATRSDVPAFLFVDAFSEFLPIGLPGGR